MDIGPTPELKAACRIVLGGDDPVTVIGAMRESPADWSRALAVGEAIVQLRALPHPTIDSITAIFDDCCAFADFDTRRSIASAAADLDVAAAEAMKAEAAALRAHAHKRRPAND